MDGWVIDVVDGTPLQHHPFSPLIFVYLLGIQFSDCPLPVDYIASISSKIHAGGDRAAFQNIFYHFHSQTLTPRFLTLQSLRLEDDQCCEPLTEDVGWIHARAHTHTLRAYSGRGSWCNFDHGFAAHWQQLERRKESGMPSDEISHNIQWLEETDTNTRNQVQGRTVGHCCEGSTSLVRIINSTQLQNIQ